MRIFGQIIRTAVNTAMLPVAVAKDIVTLGGTLTERRTSYTTKQLEKLKDEAEEDW